MTTASQSAKASKFDTEGFEHFLSLRSEPDWLTCPSSPAWQQFETGAWPDRKQEEWMRSDLRSFKLNRYQLPADPKRLPVFKPPALPSGWPRAWIRPVC